MAESNDARRKRAYRQLFLTPNGTLPEGMQKIVLNDLAVFCWAMKPTTQWDSTNRVDPYATAQAIGRQEVWNHIQKLLNLPIQDVVLMAHGFGDEQAI